MLSVALLFLQSKGEPTLLTITIITPFFRFIIPFQKMVMQSSELCLFRMGGRASIFTGITYSDPLQRPITTE
jgi:hypothetical protein